MTQDSTRPRLLALISQISLVGLITLCVIWEMWLAPFKPGGSIFVLKLVPLLFPLKGVFKKNIYTMQWSSMLILFYFIEGVVRAMGDAEALSRYLAATEILLSLLFFTSAIYFVAPYKKIAKKEKKKLAQQEQIISTKGE